MQGNSKQWTRCRFRIAWIVQIAVMLFLLPAFAIEPANEPPATFESDVLPILKAHCGECHGNDSAEGGLRLMERDDLILGGESGAAVTAGNDARSLLMRQIATGKMPPEGPRLTEEQVATVRRWINSGCLRDGENAGLAEQRISELSATEPEVFVNVFYSHCLECHGKWKKEAGLDLRSRASVLKGGKSGPGLFPGDPENSLVYRRIVADEMPPEKSILGDAQYVTRVPVSDIETLRRWIAAGAPPAPSRPRAVDSVLTKERLQHWSFQALERPPVPAVRNAQHVRNPIDAFLLSRLEHAGITLSAIADPLVLLRRASFALTGLPPSGQDVERVLTARTPVAIETMIDRLLESPHYGEHQAVWWLDGAGYADTHGQINRDEFRPFMWRYRDYVIRAFNDNKPYDRFLIEQLAGDELVDWRPKQSLSAEQIDALIATGFLRTASDATDEAAINKVPYRIGVVNEQIEIISTAIMGVTLECARCHSHKFDPIPHEDYYRFAAIFRSALDPYDWRIPNVWLYPPKHDVPEQYSRDLFHESDQLTPEVKRHNAAIDEQIERESDKSEVKKLAARKIGKMRIHGLADTGGEPTPVYVFKRGDVHQPSFSVEPGVPIALSKGIQPFDLKPPSASHSSGRRHAFARWLTQEDHPLTARVIVNRVWLQHFGRGLVSTSGNFGRAGATPSHPQLLDWLATEFVREGWSIKQLHRLIMTSTAWRQSSRLDPTQSQVDPDNELLSRFPLRRLPAEAIRDAILFVSGQLDPTPYGPPDTDEVTPDGEVRNQPGALGHRRSIYLVDRRNSPNTLLEVFDAPSMVPNCLGRTDSIVPTQALQLSNSELVHEAAGCFAARLLEGSKGNATRIEAAYQIAFARLPTTAELARDESALRELASSWEQALRKDHRVTDTRGLSGRRALESYCHALLNAPEFIYVD
jgi:mono/diheme cytochrome c family protein